MSEFFDVRAESPTLRRATLAFADAFLAEVLPHMKLAARGGGYALAVHGTRSRDVDMIAIPWVASADDPEFLVKRLCGVLAGFAGRAYPSKDWADKPHGRRAVTIIMPGMCPEIDLSIMPRMEKDDGQ